MDIKSTKYKSFNFKWTKKIMDYIPIDKLTFVFSVVFGILLGFVVMGTGSIAPVIIGLVVTILFASFGAMDSGTSSFIYIIRLGLYTIVVANILVLYPSTKLDYNKQRVEILKRDVLLKGGKRIAVEIYDTETNSLLRTINYTLDKRELVDKLYKNTKYINYNIQYFPLIKYSRQMVFYDD